MLSPTKFPGEGERCSLASELVILREIPMHRLTTTAWLAFALAGATAHAGDPAAEEAKKLQGEWQAVEAQAKGKTVAKDDEGFKSLRFLIKGDQLTIPSPGGDGKGRRKTFKLD